MCSPSELHTIHLQQYWSFKCLLETVDKSLRRHVVTISQTVVYTYMACLSVKDTSQVNASIVLYDSILVVRVV